MTYEFVGGPMDGELRDLTMHEGHKVAFWSPPPKMTKEEKERIKLRVGVYQMAYDDRAEYMLMVWQGETDEDPE